MVRERVGPRERVGRKLEISSLSYVATSLCVIGG